MAKIDAIAKKIRWKELCDFTIEIKAGKSPIVLQITDTQIIDSSRLGVDWQCKQFEAAKHCLFLQRTLTGNGNYTVGIVQGGALKPFFFLLDSPLSFSYR